jgi:hypothetical protein
MRWIPTCPFGVNWKKRGSVLPTQTVTTTSVVAGALNFTQSTSSAFIVLLEDI